MDNKLRYIKKEIICWNNSQKQKRNDYIIEERSVTIYANSNEVIKRLCSPWDLEYLAVGYLFFVGKIKSLNQITDIIVDTENSSVNVLFSEDYLLVDSSQPNEYNLLLSHSKVSNLASKLENISDTFAKTGGIHCAALADSENILFFNEDVGRHSALDKLLGRCLLDNIDTTNKILVFSGRLPVEIISKAVKLKAPVIISCSAPTNEALNIADKGGLTVIGFARGNKFNIYTHPERIN